MRLKRRSNAETTFERQIGIMKQCVLVKYIRTDSGAITEGDKDKTLQPKAKRTPYKSTSEERIGEVHRNAGFYGSSSLFRVRPRVPVHFSSTLTLFLVRFRALAPTILLL